MACMRLAFEPLTMTMSPARTAATTIGSSAAAVGCQAPCTGPGSASKRCFINGPAAKTRSMRFLATSAASPACSSGARVPSSSMSPSTAMRRPAAGSVSVECERRSHRRGVGVIALVDQSERPAFGLEYESASPPGRHFETCERLRRAFEIEAERLRGKQHGQRIDGEMAPRRAEPVGEIAARNMRRHHAWSAASLTHEAAHRRARSRRRWRYGRRPTAAPRPQASHIGRCRD